MNGRIKPFQTELDDELYRSTTRSAAERLYVDGGFNVNSTSVEAWHAFLNTFRGLSLGNKTDGQGIFPRSLYQAPKYLEGTVNGVSDADATWEGWRHIVDDSTDDQLHQLAEAIVEEVKVRGPFLSLSDFVNRKLVDDNGANSEARLGLSGALQAALDRTLNQNFDDSYEVLPSEADYHVYEAIEHIGSGPIFDIDGTEIAPASTAAGIPGWVLQGDLLQALAPAMTVRSDTFTIRSYGNFRDPINGTVRAESYVEAVVQRVPEYVDSFDSADVMPVTALTAGNQLAGRRFKIVGIRFMNQSEL